MFIHIIGRTIGEAQRIIFMIPYHVQTGKLMILLKNTDKGVLKERIVNILMAGKRQNIIPNFIRL